MPRADAWSAGTSLRRTLLVALLGPAVAGLSAAFAYATVGLPRAVPISVGVALCFTFVMAVAVLHRAAWLAFLAAVPALFVLVGSVQFAPEGVLEARGVRQQVSIVGVEVAGKRHEFTLRGAGGPLAEPLVHQGNNPRYRVGDALVVLTDPDGVVALRDVDRVDSRGRLAGLVYGAASWTVIALLAGWRGHVRRREGRSETLFF